MTANMEEPWRFILDSSVSAGITLLSILLFRRLGIKMQYEVGMEGFGD
jgi:hypothetical protein